MNYSEAQAAESRAGFIHKTKIVLKELRETLVCLKIIDRKRYLGEHTLDSQLQEVNELISIFGESCQTVKKYIQS